MDKLRSSWFAWKDINSPEFLECFSKIWDNTLIEVESLFIKCNYKCNLRDITKVGLTLQPNIGFNYSPIVNSYFVNVWAFLFCFDSSENSLFFRPSFLIANELVHEHAHFEFRSKHKMMNKNRVELMKFQNTYGVEMEKFALSEESKFLKKIKNVLPEFVDITMFRVGNWFNDGTPNNFEIWSAQIMVRQQILKIFKDVRRKKGK